MLVGRNIAGLDAAEALVLAADRVAFDLDEHPPWSVDDLGNPDADPACVDDIRVEFEFGLGLGIYPAKHK